MKSEEEVFCLMRVDIDRLWQGLPQGAFQGDPPERLLDLPQHFLARGRAEEDPSYKQLIPYQLFCCDRRFFVYQRGGGVGEGRLIGRLSLGIGGHINLQDGRDGRLDSAGYQAALHRERQEELLCADTLPGVFLGWINDESSPVGRVHLGAVHLGLIESESNLAIRPHGEDLHFRGWWSASMIRQEAEQFEAWSLLALELAERHLAVLHQETSQGEYP